MKGWLPARTTRSTTLRRPLWTADHISWFSVVEMKYFMIKAFFDISFMGQWPWSTPVVWEWLQHNICTASTDSTQWIRCLVATRFPASFNSWITKIWLPWIICPSSAIPIDSFNYEKKMLNRHYGIELWLSTYKRSVWISLTESLILTFFGRCKRKICIERFRLMPIR